LNELDTVKQALMLSAGSEGTVRRGRSSTPWNIAATGMEAVNAGIDVAKVLVGSVAGGLVSSVDKVLRGR